MSGPIGRRRSVSSSKGAGRGSKRFWSHLRKWEFICWTFRPATLRSSTERIHLTHEAVPGFLLLEGIRRVQWPARETLEARFGSRPAGQVGAQGGDGASKSLTRWTATYNRNTDSRAKPATAMSDLAGIVEAHTRSVPKLGVLASV